MTATKVKRNDPCPCGSGNKYKQCCMARDKAAQSERVAWDRAARDLRGALLGFARQDPFVRDVAIGLGIFWQDRYTADTIHLMSVDESLRFFDWFVHDYPLECDRDEQAMAGRRLIELYQDQAGDTLREKEAAILEGWLHSPPGSAFILEQADPAQGTIVIRDMFMERTLTVHDSAAATHGEIGQILLARPLPEHEYVRLSGATVVLPADEQEPLRGFMDQARRDSFAEESGISMAEFLRAQSYLFTHYAMAWAEREDRPAVSAHDPNARKPGGQAVRKLVTWRQETVKRS